MQEILKSDLDSRVTLGEIEVFSSDQLKSYAQQSYDEIQKSNDSERESHLKQVASEIRSFKPIMVTDDITLHKSVMFYRAMPLGGNDIQKGKPAAIGEVRIWDGKKMKKQANGKWVEVSEYGMSKREHSEEHDRVVGKMNKEMDRGYKRSVSKETTARFHDDLASKLSDKEYDEEEIEVKEYGIRWSEFDKNDRLVKKEKIFDTQARLDSFNKKLMQKDNFNKIEAML